MNRTVSNACLILALFLTFVWGVPALADAPKHCTGIYIGSELTADGSVLIGQNGDENSSHWVEVIPAKVHKADATMSVGVGPEANYPGKIIKIPQAKQTYKYITVRYTEYKGFAPPLENGGLNEHQVSIVDVWSPSRKELADMTPEGQTGLTYSDEARVAMEQAKTARQAVEIIGKMIDTHGHATYGGNTHLIADPNEGWIMEEFAGGQGLWAARRLGPDDIYVTRPGWMGDFPLDYKENPDYMGSDNLITFAEEKGWYDRASGKPFNISEVYEMDRDQCWIGSGIEPEEQPGHQSQSELVRKAFEYFEAKKGNITVQDVMNLLRSRPYSNPGTKYSQVAQLHSDMDPDLNVLWIAIGPPETSIFVPFYAGITTVPLEYQEHRYLTKGEAMRFSLPKERQGQETTRYAYRIYDRLYMLNNQHFETFYPQLDPVLLGCQKQLLEKQAEAEAIGATLIKSKKRDLAQSYLTYYSSTEAMRALETVEALADGLQARTRARFGINPLPRP